VRACGAERGAVARRRCPTSGAALGPPAQSPQAARRTGVRAHPGRARGTPPPRAGAGRGAVAAPAMPRRATSPMMHHARAGQRAARGQRRRGVGGWGEGTSPRGCKQRTPAHAEFWCTAEMRGGSVFSSPRCSTQFAVISGLRLREGSRGPGRIAAEGWARGRPEWGIHRAARRAELVHETRSSRATPTRRRGCRPTACAREGLLSPGRASLAQDVRRARASYNH
jgi:hypothetical protein